MAADKLKKHETRKPHHYSTEPIEGIKGEAFSEMAPMRKLAKQTTKKTIAKVVGKKSGKISKKMAKKTFVEERIMRKEKSPTRKKAVRFSTKNPLSIKWEPVFRLLTGQYLCDFIEEK